MIKTYFALFVGGVLPATLWAIGTIFQKLSVKSGLNFSAYLFFISAGVFVTSVLAYFIFNDTTFSFKGGFYAFIQGLCFSAGVTFLAVGLTKFNMPVSQLSPITSLTTLFTVIFALTILAEYQSINVLQLLTGAIFMVIGAIIVSHA